MCNSIRFAASVEISILDKEILAAVYQLNEKTLINVFRFFGAILSETFVFKLSCYQVTPCVIRYVTRH